MRHTYYLTCIVEINIIYKRTYEIRLFIKGRIKLPASQLRVYVIGIYCAVAISKFMFCREFHCSVLCIIKYSYSVCAEGRLPSHQTSQGHNELFENSFT